MAGRDTGTDCSDTVAVEFLSAGARINRNIAGPQYDAENLRKIGLCNEQVTSIVQRDVTWNIVLTERRSPFS